MNTSKRMTLLAISAMLVLAACGRNNEPNNDNNTTPPANNTTPNNMTTPNNATSNNTAVNNTAVNNTAVNNTAVNNTAVNNTAVNNTTANNTTVGDTPVADPADDTTIVTGETQSYSFSGLDSEQAYRITLVVDANVNVTDGAGTFVDNDMNGAADAGTSENVALITSVNGQGQPGAKTVPAGTDDPANPSGIFPSASGEITIEVTGVGAGKVYPVLYVNGGDSTFLEVDAGTPTELHLVGGGLTVEYAYAFATEGPEAFTRVDRKGMPAVATALISSKDAYNAAGPADDANGDFVTEIVTSIDGLHNALDDDLLALGLTPCTVVGDGSGTCVAQGAPLVVPDTLKIDTAGDAGFPNGRRLADPVMDVTLAVVLLELSVHAADTLAGVPVNPPANDLEFKTDFFYLADFY